MERGLLTGPLDRSSLAERELHEMRATGAVEADMQRLRAELSLASPSEGATREPPRLTSPDSAG